MPAATVAVIPLAGVAVWAPFGAAAFAVGAPFALLAGVVWTVTGVAIGLGRRVQLPGRAELAGILAMGLTAAVLGSRWQAMLMGDGLFHAGVIRKLLAVDRLSLASIWQYQDGHPHPGYAFPILHLVQAGMAFVTRMDPSTAFSSMTPAFAFLVPVSAYAIGSTVMGRAAGVATAALATWGAVTQVGYLSYAQQPRYVVTFVALPVFLLLVVQAADRPSQVLHRAIVVSLLLIAMLHLTYVPPLLLVLGAVSVGAPRLRVVALSAAFVCAAFAAWVYAVAILGGHGLGRQPVNNANFVMVAGHRAALSGLDLLRGRPEYVIAGLAALVLVRMRGTKIGVLALCTLILVALTSLPGPMLVVQAVTGPGQALRYSEEVPWVYFLGPALVVLARVRPVAIVALAVVSVALDRTGVLNGGSATWFSLALGVATLAVLTSMLWRPLREGRPFPAGRWVWSLAATAAVLLGPLSLAGDAVADEAVHGKPTGYLTNEPTPGGIAFLRAHDGPIPVVLAPYAAGTGCWFTGISYELVGEATVYAVAISTFHTEASPLDDSPQRRSAVDRFLAPDTPAAIRDGILRRYHVGYVVLDLKQSAPALVRQLAADPFLHRVYRDPPTADEYARFIIFATRHGT